MSAADGSYSLSVNVPGGQGGGFIDGFDFALPPVSDLTIEVVAQNDELLADGMSTSAISAARSGLVISSRKAMTE